MIELSQLTLLVLIEVLIALVILSSLLVYFALARKGRIRKAAHRLAERVQSDKTTRGERLKTLLSEKYGLTGGELDQTLHNITQAEMQLFQNLINGYMKDDQVHLQQVDVDEENLILAYQGLKLEKASAAPPMPAGEGEDVAEMLRLQDENKRLSDELRVTMDTMGRMLNEYSSMFSGGSDKPLSRAAAAEAAEEALDEDQEPDQGLDALPEEVDIDVDIPDYQAETVALDPMADDPDELLDSEAEASSVLDEEVSEIIDEVMEMADGMTQHTEEPTEAETPIVETGESLLDELEQVDIEIPDSTPAEQSGAETESEIEPEPEPGSLEDEWAKLLEEDAASKQKPD